MTLIQEFIATRDGDYAPFYVIDLARLRSNFDVIAAYFGAHTIYYAVKANADPVILRCLASCGAGFEVGSIGELERVLGVGISGNRILFSNPCKDELDIIACQRAGVRWFAFETLDDLRRLRRLVPGAEYALRLDLSHVSDEFIDYGVTISEIAGMIAEDSESCSMISGLTFYGCHATGLDLCERIISDLLPGVRYVNLGGGFLHPSVEEELSTGHPRGALRWLVQRIEELRAKHPVQLIVEPGGVLVKSACHGISRVKYARRGPTSDFYHVNLGPSLGLTKPVSEVFLLRKEGGRDKVREAWLVDSTCAKQRLVKLVEIHELRVGDHVVFPCVGHYSTMYMSDFQLLEKPEMIYLPVESEDRIDCLHQLRDLSDTLSCEFIMVK